MKTSPVSAPNAPQESIDAAFFPGFATLRDVLDLVAILRDESEPIDSPEGLRRAIDAILKLAQSLGLNPELLATLRALSDNPRTFEVLLALARFMVDLIQPSTSPLVRTLDFQPQTVDPGMWLAIVLEVIAVLRRLRERS